MDVAFADPAHGWSGAGVWDHCLLTDDEISRPAEPDRLWRQFVDVCYADHLPGFEYSGEMAMGGGLEPGHTDRRNLPGGIFGRRRRLLAATGLQYGVHAGGAVCWGRDLQSRRKDLY